MDIASIQAKHEARLLALPNVCGVGIGKKGKRSAILVFVTRKVPRAALAPDDVVPGSLDGVLVDVIEIGTVTVEDP